MFYCTKIPVTALQNLVLYYIAEIGTSPFLPSHGSSGCSGGSSESLRSVDWFLALRREFLMMSLHMYSAATFHENDGRSSEISDSLELLLLLLLLMK